jgi:hypothetical protein
MTVDWHLFARFAAPIAAVFIGAALSRWWERRPRLISYLAHAIAVPVRPPEGEQFQVNTHSIVVRNAGKRAATNVRLGHHVLPNFSVYPSVHYSVVDLPGGGKELLFPALVPGEQITVAYLYSPPVFWQHVNSHTKSDEGFAKIVTALPTPMPSPKVRVAAVALMAAGTATVLYALFELAWKVWRWWFGA